MSQQGLEPRRAALFILDKVIVEGRLMSDLVSDGALDHLPPQDRARAGRLATQTLRAMPRADRLLARFLKKTPPTQVRNILRLSTVELAGGEAAHGVVNAAVAIVGMNRRTAGMKGLVNAVLRKVADDMPDGWQKLGVPRLPKWLRDPLKDAYGPQITANIERVHFEGAPLDLTARQDPEAVAKATGGTVLPTGTVRLRDAGQVSTLPGYEAGDWWVQDAAAALPARLLATGPGDKVLDICAAPGGKTMQLAATGADVTALDISEARMARVAQNLKRTGLQARTIVRDALAFHETGFDAILLDAPCSATGTIRRHPDLPHAKDGSDFFGLFQLQSDLIDHALTLLKPGGRMVFCTCSLLPDEGEVQAEAALTRHPDLIVDKAARDLPGVPEDWHSPEGGIRTRPDLWADRGGMDGFYMVRLRKPA